MLNGPSAYIVIGQPVILAFLSHQLDEHLDRVLLTAVVEKQGLCPMTVAKLRDGEIAVLTLGKWIRCLNATCKAKELDLLFL